MDGRAGAIRVWTNSHAPYPVEVREKKKPPELPAKRVMTFHQSKKNSQKEGETSLGIVVLVPR